MAASLLRTCHFLLLFVPAFWPRSSAQRNDDPAFDRKETRGNVTFGCYSPGPCIPCSYLEKNDEETYHCSISGYRQSYKCTELSSNGGKGHIVGTRKLVSVNKLNVHEKNTVDIGHRFFGSQKLDLSIHDEHKFVRLYFSCLPTDTDEKLTVWGFEAIMLGLLGISAPVIYHRRKRNFATSGMTRLPTSARF